MINTTSSTVILRLESVLARPRSSVTSVLLAVTSTPKEIKSTLYYEMGIITKLISSITRSIKSISVKTIL